MDEVDVDAVDLGRELREVVQPLLEAPEVVVVRPVVGERLQRGELDTLRAVVDELLARPARGLEAAAQLAELLVGNVYLEGTDLGGSANGGTHGSPHCLYVIAFG